MAAATKNAREIFLDALDRAPAVRAAYLDEACAGDAGLRQRVEALLHAHNEPAAFLSAAKPDPNATATLPPASPLVGTTLAGRYKLLEEIGDGGMGTVWMAEQREPVKRLVAVKLIKAGMDSKAVLARFEAERQALALMDHLNIAKVLDGGTTEDGRPYFVMELVKGLPLTEYCDARRLSVRDRLDLFVQICSAVQHAHQKAVIHRDLKPSNILVTEHDGKPVPKVIDFGLAKALNATTLLTERTLHTAYGTVVGTPLYMAPEQVGINALDVDTRTDVYALGVILYELLVGSTPLEKAQLKQAAWEEVKRLIREVEPPRPSTRLSSSASLPSLAASRQVEPAQLSRLLRGELDWIVMKALEKDRSRRYETANGLAKDVERYLAGDTVEACPPTVGYRLRKAYRRNRTAVWVAGAFLGLASAAAVVGTVLAVQANRAEDAANRNAAAAVSAEAEATAERDKVAKANDALRWAKYAAEMNLAQAAWEANDVGRVLQLLDRQRPKPGEVDLRGFEWHYWNRQCHAALHTLKLPVELITFQSYSPHEFSPDGAVAAGVTVIDGRLVVRLWDTTTGRERQRLEGPAPLKAMSLWHCLAFSPDGKRLAASLGCLPFDADSEGELRVWELASGRELARFPDIGAAASGLAFSADGSRVAVSHVRPPQPDNGWKTESVVKVWDVDGRKEALSLSYRDDGVAFVDPSPDGKRLAVAIIRRGDGDEGSFRLMAIDVATKKELWTTPPIAGSYAISVRYRPDGARLALVSDQRDGVGTLHVFDAETGKALVSGAASVDSFTRITYSHDGRRLAGFHRRVSVWDADTGKLLQTCNGHQARVTAGAFNRDGTRLITADRTGVVHHWDVTPREPPPPLKVGPNEMVIGGVSRDLRRVVFGRATIYNGEPIPKEPVLVLDRDNKELTRIEVAAGFVSDLALSPDGRRIAGLLKSPRRDSNRVVVWDAADGRELHSWPGLKCKPTPFLLGFVHFSPDGTRVAAVLMAHQMNNPEDSQNALRIWDTTTGKEVASISGGGSDFFSMAFRADGKQLVTISASGDPDKPTGVARVWDAATGRELKTLRVPFQSSLAVALSPDGNRIATVAGTAPGLTEPGLENAVRITDVATGAELHVLNAPDVIGVDFSPDGLRLATFAFEAGKPGVVKVWDTATGQELLTFKDGPGRIVGFSADGHSLYALDSSNTAENRLKVWDATPLPEKTK